MKRIQVKAVFPTEGQFGFYGTERRYDGDVFDFEYDDSDPEKNPLENQLGSWMEPIEKPKAKKKTKAE